MKLLYPFSGVAGIFFPVEKLKDGGTCEFASNECLQECASFKNSTTNTIIPYRDKKAVYEYMTKEPVFTVCQKITDEMKNLKVMLLYWFASGECMRKYTNKIAQIIKHLSLEGIVQCGFTRNRKLWDTVHELDRVHLILTVENKSTADKTKIDGMIAVPNYKIGAIKLYRGDVYYGTCGGARFSLNEMTTAVNCLDCYQQKRGCFNEEKK